MTAAPQIFACLLHVMSITKPVLYPVIDHNTDLLMEWHQDASTNKITGFITVRDGMDLKDLDRKDRRDIAHEFTRYLLLKTEPNYTQQGYTNIRTGERDKSIDSRVHDIEVQCYEP